MKIDEPKTAERPQIEDFIVTLCAFLFSLGLAIGASSIYLLGALQ